MRQLSKYFGGVFLVSGTTIGAGMLALPVLTSFIGFIPSIVIFIALWLVMLTSAFFLLDVYLEVGKESNLISMVQATLGSKGKSICWFFYLLLLYALIAAYISASGPIFATVFQQQLGLTLSLNQANFILPIVLGFFVYLGAKSVDFINRVLMVGLIVSYVLLIRYIAPSIEIELLSFSDWRPTFVVIPVVITSFGYHIIIPSLGTYFGNNRIALRRIIIIGSVIPLIFYILWQALILGAIPLQGEWGLISAFRKGQSAIIPLSKGGYSNTISIIAQFFSFFAIITSFLGVSLSLSDFIRDGLNLKTTILGRLTAYSITFIPPLFFALYFQQGFFLALQYAGVFVAILLIIFPALMTKYIKSRPFYSSNIGKGCCFGIICIGIIIILVDLVDQWGFFNRFIGGI